MSGLEVRELSTEEIPLILDYWYGCDEVYMRSLGTDISKLPPRSSFRKALEIQIKTPYKFKKAFATIWYKGGTAMGHSNVDQIHFGQSAKMHLHIWHPHLRQKGNGSLLIKKSILIFFQKLHLENLYCEPYALNTAPNKTLKKIGFTFEKKYTTIPGYLNFEQPVNRYMISKHHISSWK